MKAFDDPTRAHDGAADREIDDALLHEFETRVAAGADPVQVYLAISLRAGRGGEALVPGKHSTTSSIPGGGVIAREAGGGGAAIDTDAARRIASARTGGRPLEAELRRLFEQALGHGLEEVRVHTGPAADDAARAVGARAFALGADLFFRDGAYDPGSTGGVRLIAHEVAHAAQAGRGELSATLGLAISEPGDASERAADQFADAIVSAPAAPAPITMSAAAPALRRDPTPGAPALTDEDKAKLRDLNGQQMSGLLTGVEALDPDQRALYYGHLDEVGVNVKRMKVAFRAGDAKRSGVKARDFAFADEEMYAMCRSLELKDQRNAVFTFVEPGFKPPDKLEPGTAIRFKDGREGIVHRGYVKRQRAKNQLPWMCNNPGAVGNGPSFKSPNTYPGKSIGPAAINIYPSEEDGMKGLTAWIEFQGRVNDMTFGGFFHAHAPSDDGKAGNKGNDPEAYFNRVAANMGLDPKTARGQKIRTMDARKIANGIAAVGEGYSLGGDVLIWPQDDKELDREVWFSMMYWENAAP